MSAQCPARRWPIHATVGVLLFSHAAFAADRPLLDVDFQKPNWSELLTRQQDAAAAEIDDGAIRLEPGVGYATQLFPNNRGQSIRISLKVRCRSVAAGDAAYKVGRAILVGYDNTKREVCHRDILVVSGDRDWSEAGGQHQFNDGVRWYGLQLANQGSSGTVWFDDVRIAIGQEGLEEMIGDPSFEGTLGVDHWYFQKNGVDWDDLAVWSEGSEILDDTEQPVLGGRCIRITGPATLVSKAFAYHGEELRFGAWKKAVDITCGRTGWSGVGIQLVGQDESGRHLCHGDLDLFTTGDKGWEYAESSTRFSEAVKKVQLWIRFFDGAGGTVWFDQVWMARQPLTGAVPPFDPEKAELAIDASKPGQIINHRVWSGVDLSYCSWLLRPDVQETLPYLTEAGIDWMRVHDPINAVEAYRTDDEHGNPVYDWTRFDQIFDMLVRQYRITPIVTIESTPQALDTPGVRRPHFCNRLAPSDMGKWGRFIEAIFDRVVDRYGKDGAEQWLWEIYNEPGGHYYLGTDEEFQQLSEQVYLAAQRVEQRRGVDLKMGLTSGGPARFEERILRWLQERNQLDAIDHYSSHVYIGSNAPIRLLGEFIPYLHRYKTMFPGLKDCPVGITEWNCNSMTGEPADLPWNASMVVKAVRLMLDADLDYAAFFNLIDHPEVGNVRGFSGYLGMFTKHPAPKPVYNAFVFLHQLRSGRRLDVVSTNDPIDGLAVVMPDQTIRIVLVNYDEDLTRQPYQTQVNVSIKTPQPRDYRCTRHWCADEEHGDSYGKWIELGRPDLDVQGVKAQLREAAQYGQADPVPVVRDGQTLSFALACPSPGIRFIELTPITPEPAAR